MFFFFQAEDGIRDLVRSRGLGDVYKRQGKSDDRNTSVFGLVSPTMSPCPRARSEGVTGTALSLIHI